MLDNLPTFGPRDVTEGVSRRVLLALGLVLLVAVAGCSGAITGSDAEPADQAPEDSNVLVHLDMALLQDDDTQELLDGFAEEGTTEEDAEDLFEEFEDDTGLDLREAREALLFGEIPEDRMAERTTAGFIVYADWAEEDVVSSLEEEGNDEYQQTEYHGESVLYEPVEEPQFGEATYLGVLGDGQYVIGDESSVRGALDVEYDDADPASGLARDVYDDARDGYLTIAVAPPADSIPTDPGPAAPSQIDFSAFQDVEAFTMVYDTNDGAAVIEMTMMATDESDAQDIEDVTDGAVSFTRGSIEDDDITDELRKIEIERDAKTVTVTYESDIEDILDTYETLEQL